jgi:hypothetical protein
MNKITRNIVTPLLALGLVAVWVAFIFLKVDYPSAFEWLTIAAASGWIGAEGVKALLAKMK